MKKSLAEYRRRIRANVDYVDVKPYSHNIIGLVLGMIDEHYGQAEANKAIRDFGLDELGWSVRVDKVVEKRR